MDPSHCPSTHGIWNYMPSCVLSARLSERPPSVGFFSKWEKTETEMVNGWPRVYTLLWGGEGAPERMPLGWEDQDLWCLVRNMLENIYRYILGHSVASSDLPERNNNTKCSSLDSFLTVPPHFLLPKEESQLLEREKGTRLEMLF